MRRATVWVALCAFALVPGAGVTAVDASRPPPAATSAVETVAGAAGRGAGTGVDQAPASPDARTYAYGSHPDQRLTVHPAQRGRRSGAAPVILLLHGGYWAYRSTWSTVPETLGRQGFVVLDAGYTLSPNGLWPAPFDDARAALDWAVQHAKELDADPGRVLVMGTSAGGQLAALLGTHPSARERVRGVIALSPVVDLHRAWVRGGRSGANPRQRQLRVATEEVVGCPPLRSQEACWGRWKSTRVGRYASKEAAPLLIVHSEGDYVPAADSRALAARLPHATVTVVPGDGHGRKLLAHPGLTGKLVDWAKSRLR